MVERDGICFTDLLQLSFIILKIVGVIDWSWWIVLSPFIITFGLLVLMKLMSDI